KMPLAVSGKVNRKTLPLPEITGSKNYVPPGNITEEQLVELWSEILNLEKEKIGIDDNFFHLGGQSLKTTSLTSKIYKTFDVKIFLAEIFKNPTVREIAALIEILGWTSRPVETGEDELEKEEFVL
ncbi:MAG: hypothetical protein GY757_41860, partial [bacterium]|nr:hypothetical protein [bacterium]